MRFGPLIAGLFIAIVVLSLALPSVVLAQPDSMADAVESADLRTQAGPQVDQNSVHGLVSPTGQLDATDEENQLVRQISFELRPDEPGVVGAEMRFEIPEQVVELDSAIPDRATVIGTDGFDASGDGNYSWDGDTVEPSISLTLSVNRTGDYHLSSTMGEQSTETGDGLMFVDTGDWAIVSVPPASVWWSSYQNEPPVTFVGETAASGSGVAGDRMVFLGPHTKATRTIDGQTVTVVLPDAATLESSTEGVLDAFEAASPHLPSSPVSRSVVIAAPTTVDWGPYGLADRSDTWVRADQPLDEPGNVWLHEFVHLRQNFTTATDTQWIREGMPEYYAALLTLEQGTTDFGAFSDHLDRGTQSRYEDVVLSQPDTWTELANYANGALVYGTIDRRIRLDSAQTASARLLFESMNEHDQPIDQAFLESELSGYASAETVSDIRTYVQTTETPAMWSRTDHKAAFGASPPDINLDIGDAVLAGPYRNSTVAEIPVLVPGEQLSTPVTVRNDGEETGTYELVLAVNGSGVASASGSLSGGESTTVSLSHTFDRTGPKTLSLDSTTWNLTVRDPATPSVTSLVASETSVHVGSEVTVSATISNEDAWPANGTVPVGTDGTKITDWRVRLAPQESVERSITLQMDAAGERTIEAGSETVTITVTDPSQTETTADTDSSDGPTTTSDGSAGTTPIETPGFTIGSILVAFVWFGLWVGRTRI